MTTTVVVLLAATGVLVAAVAVLGRRRRSESGERVARAVDDMRERMDALATDLSQALERADRETRRNRLLGELSTSIDLDELVERLLDHATDVRPFDAALITLGDTSGTRTAMRGMTAGEAPRPPTPASVAPGGTVTVNYRYGSASEAAAAGMIRGGVFVPLKGRDLEPLGTLAVFWRTEREPGPEAIEAIEALAELSVPAIDNARRYSEARQLAETDPLTGLFNKRYFDDTLRREVLRAQRYGRALALLVIDLDNFKEVNDRVGHLAGDAALSQAAQRLQEAVRSVDIACRIGGDEFAVILPESGIDVAEKLFQRVRDLLASSTPNTGYGLRMSGGIAELHHGDTAAALFERADAALYRAKDSGKDRAESARDRRELSPG